MLFDPLGGGEEDSYLGVPEGEGVSVATETGSVDAMVDIRQLKHLWQLWSSIVESGRHMSVK